ncbi:UDP-N-acetylmuramoyl-L-alanine--D-glutamate ligase, partial [Candidatus Gracilibacteria bacterium]|nr:UDP-N-acetylmuramoyl-L-alanine--D-glutamate ligase [Candidatus Gracilibacteria bacterium]
MKLEKLKKYTNNKVAILGFGKEGKSTLNFLLKLGFKNITILDKNEKLSKQKNINYKLGNNYLEQLSDYKLIFKSPGISPYNTLIEPYKNKLISQAQLFFDNYNGRIIGITGTKGKSTTSTLTYQTLKEIGYNVKIVGNIGNPVLDEIDIINNEIYDYVVYELSSYMLEGLDINLYIGIINNIYDCHLDWHNGRVNYETAKFGVIKKSKNKLINYELKNNLNNIIDIKFFGENGNYFYKNGLFYKNDQVLFKDEKILLKGEHNRKNITVVLGILDIIDPENLTTNIDKLKKVLKEFTGLPHRIQNIGTYNEITFIDDAIATTPESTIAAIKTFEYNIGTIFLGGQDSGFNFNELENILKKYNILNIVLFPDTGEKIFGKLTAKYTYENEFILSGEYSPKVLKTKSMKSAVDFAFKNTPKGKICILSNAAPSFSLWSGYIEKGNEFQNEVKKYKLSN